MKNGKLFNWIASLALAMTCLFALPAAATDWNSAANYTLVNTIGKKLMSTNKLTSQIVFKVMDTNEVNAFANGSGEVYVYTGLLKFVSHTDELAAVIAHEIGHIVNGHIAKSAIIGTVTSTLVGDSALGQAANTLTMLKMSRTDEYEADITGVDLLVNAGYNPLAMVSLLNSLNAGGNTMDILSTHPAGDKRSMNAYDYICYTYPAKMAAFNTASYKQFQEYAAPIVQKRNADAKALAKFNKEQAKLADKRTKKMAKYQKENKLQNAANTARTIIQIGNILMSN